MGKLKELRKASGMTQQDVSEAIGVERVTYSRYESGSRMPSREALVKLADIFGVTTDYLLDRSDDSSVQATPSKPRETLGPYVNADLLDGKMVERIQVALIRMGSNISQAEKALRMGNSTIKRWDVNHPSIDKVVRLAKYLNVTVEYLVTGNLGIDVPFGETTGNAATSKGQPLDRNETDLVAYYRACTRADQYRLLGVAADLGTQNERTRRQRATPSRPARVADLYPDDVELAAAFHPPRGISEDDIAAESDDGGNYDET